MTADVPYVKTHSESLVGLFTCVFVKASQKPALRDLDICTVKRLVHFIYGKLQKLNSLKRDRRDLWQ